jgi:hypothetical protein
MPISLVSTGVAGSPVKRPSLARRTAGRNELARIGRRQRGKRVEAAIDSNQRDLRGNERVIMARSVASRSFAGGAQLFDRYLEQ